jgi:Luciferase-like monooxygenase
MEIGIDSFGAVISDPASGLTLSPVQRTQNLLEEIALADKVGLDVFGVGEHRRSEFVDSAPVVILAAAAMRTQRIRLTSAVTVLSAADPVRVFQEFATLDLISSGRAEIVAGRGSSIEAFPLFGFDLNDYDSLFTEKLDLLLKIRENTRIHWSGKYRAPLTGQAGWPPATRAQFEALRGPTGALPIGDAETVAQKILYVNEVLGGLARITFQMGVSALPHEKMLRSIELLGTRVAPIVRKELSALTSRS